MNNSDFYKQAVALHPDTHRNLRFDASKVDLGFARHCATVRIAASELAQAVQEYPVVFLRAQDGQFRLAALLGVEKSQNLFVSAAGLWDGDFTPACIQHYPFVLEDDSLPEQLSVDESCSALNADSGILLIDEQGELQQRVHDELQFMQDFHKEIARTGLMLRQLAELDLFVPLNEAVTGGEAVHAGDLYSIDSARFKLIAASALPELFHSGALRLAILQIDSLDNMRRLRNRVVSLSAEKQPGLFSKVPVQGERVLRTAEQGMQRPILKSLRNEAPLLLASEQQNTDGKQDVLKKLLYEKKRLEQEHRERYAKATVESEVQSLELPAVTAPAESRIWARPVWAWVRMQAAGRRGLVAIALIGAAIVWVVSGSDPGSLPVATATADDVAMSPASQTDIFADSMLRIAPGSFEMGSSDGDADEKPLLKVNISHEFEIGKTEVTQGQWKAVMGRLPEKLFFRQCGDNCPVENVSWDDVQEFIARLNAQSGKRYRLPSEAEWEYACRAGGTQRYCGGNNPDELAWYGDRKIGHSPHPVATRKPNAWGLYDMSGNVWEWVEDCYAHRYSDGRSRTGCDERVLRGGSWSNDADTPRSANRYKRSAAARFNNNGFRLARGLP